MFSVSYRKQVAMDAVKTVYTGDHCPLLPAAHEEWSSTTPIHCPIISQKRTTWEVDFRSRLVPLACFGFGGYARCPSPSEPSRKGVSGQPVWQSFALNFPMAGDS